MNAELVAAAWYAARGTGLAALVLLTVVVALGVAARSRRPLPGLPRFAVSAVHRSSSLIAVGLLVVHVGALLVDPYAQVRLLDVLVPFGAGYRPLWVGLGTVALDLLVVLVASSLLRQRIGLRVWRALHWAGYACWPVALAHSVGSGTDAGTLWLRVTAVGCVVVVAAALGWRLSDTFGTPVHRRVPVGVTLGRTRP